MRGPETGEGTEELVLCMEGREIGENLVIDSRMIRKTGSRV